MAEAKKCIEPQRY